MSAATTVRNFTDATVTITDDGGNSATCPLLIGTISWSDLRPDGREQVRYESQGAMTGHRKEARAYPTVTISAQVHRLDDDFVQLAMGEIAGFVSTVADIGDAATVDVQIDESYSTDVRLSTWDDCDVSVNYEAGSPSQITITFTCGGPVVIDGVTYISSR